MYIYVKAFLQGFLLGAQATFPLHCSAHYIFHTTKYCKFYKHDTVPTTEHTTYNFKRADLYQTKHQFPN